jgi:serine/threonine protein phosphatase PrpC
VLPPAALLLLHTDGLVDREGARDTEPLTLLRDVALADPATVADRVLAAAQRTGPATDDVAVMVVRPGFSGASPG